MLTGQCRSQESRCSWVWAGFRHGKRTAPTPAAPRFPSPCAGQPPDASTWRHPGVLPDCLPLSSSSSSLASCPHPKHPKNAPPEASAEQPHGHTCVFPHATVTVGKGWPAGASGGWDGPPGAACTLLLACLQAMALSVAEQQQSSPTVPHCPADEWRQPAAPMGAGQATALPHRHHGAQGQGVTRGASTPAAPCPRGIAQPAHAAGSGHLPL